MIRISKSSTILLISLYHRINGEYSDGGEIDSIIIIPGVTNYKTVYTSNKYLIFDSGDTYISVEFDSEISLERFFTQLLRDIKLNNILDIKLNNEKS